MPQINTATITGSCIASQSFLLNFFGQNTPQGRDTGDFGLFQALLSNANTAGTQDLSNYLVGPMAKKNTIKLLYDNATCYSVCAKIGTCSTVPTTLYPAVGELEITLTNAYTLCDTGNGVNINIGMDSIEWEKFCTIDTGNYWQRKIAQADFQFVKGLNKLLAAELNSMVDSANVFSKKLTVQTTSGTTILNPDFQFFIEQKLRDAGVENLGYMIIGGSKIKHIEKLAQIQSASMEGFDITKQGQFGMMYYSKALDAIAPGAIIILPYQTVRLLTYAEYGGNLETMTELLTDSTKQFPIGNGLSLKIDYRTEYDPKCKKRTYQPSVLMELIKTIPGGCDITDPTKLPIFKIIDCSVAPTLDC